MRSGEKAVARRASALLMSALLVFSTCPVEAMAQEQGDGETESPVLLVDDTNETTDEIGDLAQELPPSDPAEDELPNQEVGDTENIAEPPNDDAAQQSENVEEGAQSESGNEQDVEESPAEEDSAIESEPALLESVRTQSTGAMIVDENPTGKSYYFDLSDETDKTTAYVKVHGVTSGDVSYDSTTATLRLSNASVSGEIESVGYLTLELVGSNTVRGYDSFYSGSYYDNDVGEYVYYDDYNSGYENSYDAAIGVNGKLTINNDGSIDTYYYYNATSCTAFEIKNGTIDGRVNTNGGNATVSGGTVSEVYTGKRNDDGDYVAWGNLTISDGTIGSTSCGTLDVRGGKIVGGANTNGGNVTFSGGTVGGDIYTYGGNVTFSGGTITGNVSCKTLTLSNNAMIEDGAYCGTIIMQSGTIEGGVECENGNATVSGGTINDGISCGKLTVAGGTISEGNSYRDKVSCSSLEMRGGKIVGTAYTNGGNASVTGGTITGSVSTGKRDDDGDYVAWGSLTISDGTIGGTSCGTLTVSGKAKITYKHSGSGSGYTPIKCTKLFMRGGSISITGDGDESPNPIECDSLTMTSGSITVSNWSEYYSDREISTKQLTMTGGSINVGIDAEYYSNDREVGGNVSIANGTIGGDISCGKFTLGKKSVIKGGISGADGIITGSSVGGGVSGNNVTVTGGSVGGGVSGNNVTVTGGSVGGGVSATTVTVSGGSVSGDVGTSLSRYDDYWSKTSVVISGGTVRGSVNSAAVTISGGSVSGRISATTVTISGGKVNYKGTGANDSSTAVSCTTLTMRGGSIKVSKCGGVISCKTMTMAGGSIRADNCDGGIEAQEYADAKTANITIKKGTIVMNNPSGGCISSSHGNIAIKGGTITIKGSYGGGIYAGGTTYRGKRYGGKIKITGGKLTIITRKPSQSYAISADSITNKPSCLKKIVGRLSTGARFKVGGNTYQVSDYYSNYVNVYRYNSKKTEAKFKTVKYGKQKYNVSGVAANAFNTKQGAAVTSITFYGYMQAFGANAFKGTKSMRSLIFRNGFSNVYVNWNGSTYKLKVDKQYFKCNKKAFSGAGAKGGSGLTVTMRDSASEAHLYRPFLLKKGLPKSATVTASYFNN